MVEHAQGADRQPVLGLEQRTGIGTDMWFADHQRVAVEAGVAGEIRHDEQIVLQQRPGAERTFQRRRAHAETDLGFEELAVGGDQIDHRDRRIAQPGGQRGEFVERRLARRVHHRIARQRCQPPRLPLVDGVHIGR